MSNKAIRVENLGKQYQIGQTIRHDTLRDQLASGISRLIRRNATHSTSTDKRTFWALDDISFELEKGEVLGIIGKNGAGKSTLLKVISQITKPTRGRIEIRGRVGSLLEVGTGFHSELTGRENVYMNASILGMTREEIRRKFDEIVAFAEVERFIDTPIKRYSSGMQMRLAFAVAAHIEPEILVVDEVLAVGDAEFQKKSLGRMNMAASEGRTVLFVSHNMAAVRSMCSQVLWLKDGKVEQLGDTTSTIDDYLFHAYRQSETQIETLNLPRVPPFDCEELWLTYVELHTQSGSPIIYTDEEIKLTIRFLVNEPLEDVVLGAAIDSQDNVRIFDLIHLDTFEPIRKLAPGTYEAQCVAKNMLLPGTYWLHVGIRTASSRINDTIMNLLSFSVESREQVDSIYVHQRYGMIHMPSTWEYHSI